jgi:hypothetical protein
MSVIVDLKSAVLAKSSQGIDLIDKVVDFIHGESEHKVSRFDSTFKKIMALLMNEHDLYKKHIKFVNVPDELVKRFSVAWDGKKEIIFLLSKNINSITDPMEYKTIKKIPHKKITETINHIHNFDNIRDKKIDFDEDDIKDEYTDEDDIKDEYTDEDDIKDEYTDEDDIICQGYDSTYDSYNDN